jgi:hypothetical protein
MAQLKRPDPLADKSGNAQTWQICISTNGIPFTVDEHLYRSRVIELFCGVRRGMVFQVTADSLFLVGWYGEYIAKSTATEDNLLASALGFVHR